MPAAAAAIGKLVPTWLVADLTGVSFIGVAATMWRKPDVRLAKEKDARMIRGAAFAFGTIALSEWGDNGVMSAWTCAAAWVTASAPKGLTRMGAATLV